MTIPTIATTTDVYFDTDHAGRARHVSDVQTSHLIGEFLWGRNAVTSSLNSANDTCDQGMPFGSPTYGAHAISFSGTAGKYVDTRVPNPAAFTVAAWINPGAGYTNAVIAAWYVNSGSQVILYMDGGPRLALQFVASDLTVIGLTTGANLTAPLTDWRSVFLRMDGVGPNINYDLAEYKGGGLIRRVAASTVKSRNLVNANLLAGSRGDTALPGTHQQAILTVHDAWLSDGECDSHEAAGRAMMAGWGLTA